MALDDLDGPPPGSPARRPGRLDAPRHGSALADRGLRTVRPTVLDEARDIRFHLDLLMDGIPPSTPSWTAAGSRSFGGRRRPFTPSFASASWVGGDQDGQPARPGAGRSRDALRAQKQMVLARYRDSVHAISVQYSQSTRWTGADPVLAASIADDEARGCPRRPTTSATATRPSRTGAS